MASLIKTFPHDPDDFAACSAAEEFLRVAGFSVGSMQRGDPRGIMYGDYDIQKWRNLSRADRKELHGIMTGGMRNGPITIEIFGHAPQGVKREFHRSAVALSLVR